MAGIRMHVKDSVHFITNRTEHEMYLLLPSPVINALVLFWLAKAKALYGDGIQIYGFIFMSNHFHLLLKDTKGQLAEFMRYFQSGLAVSINKHFKRHGRFWAREYDDVIVDGEEEFWNRYDYLFGNPVKAGLVATPAQWKGVNSYKYALENKPIIGTGINTTAYNEAKRCHKDVKPKEFEETYEFKLAQPPAWKHWSISKRSKSLLERTKNVCKTLAKKRMGKPVSGMKRVLRTSPFERPKNPEQKPGFKFFCMNTERLKELKEAYKLHVSYYKTCINALFNCSGNLKRAAQIKWPPWSYPPTRHVPQGF